MPLVAAPHQQQLLLKLATLERAAANEAAGIDGTAGTASASASTPERIEADKAAEKLKRAHDAAAAAQMAVDDMENEILRIQQDERKLRRRNIDNKKQLATAEDPEIKKDLEHDMYTTKSRIADLMSELQEAHNEIHALRSNRDAHGARIDEAQRVLEAAQRAVDAAESAQTDKPDPAEEIAELRRQLETDAPDVLRAYETVKEENGVGAASFTGRGCGGCFIQLPPADQSAVRNAAENEVPQCTDCGTYLIRTP